MEGQKGGIRGVPRGGRFGGVFPGSGGGRNSPRGPPREISGIFFWGFSEGRFWGPPIIQKAMDMGGYVPNPKFCPRILSRLGELLNTLRNVHPPRPGGVPGGTPGVPLRNPYTRGLNRPHKKDPQTDRIYPQTDKPRFSSRNIKLRQTITDDG